MIKKEDLNNLEQKFNKNKTLQALQTALFNTQLNTVCENGRQNEEFVFSLDLKTLPVTNQKSSGRCWIFAGLNFLREKTARKFNLNNFEFSQNYISFYDRLEKSNYFIESVNKLLDVDTDDRTLQHILQNGLQDGGQWQMFVNIVKKYGLVPKQAMPETANSENSFPVNKLINTKLRRYASLARRNYQNGKNQENIKLKEETLEDIYNILVSNCGLPPKTFDFEYLDKDGKYKKVANLTPHTFYKKFVDINLDDYVSVINSPTKDKPYYKNFEITYLGNTVEDSGVIHFNLPMEEINKLIIAQLKDNVAVWFGADVGFDGTRNKGIWDDKKFDFEKLFDLKLYMTKEEKLDYRQSAMNHAMVITGVNLDNDTPNRWKIQNSWGEKPGQKGYYIMSATWFDKYVYQAVINKKYLTQKQQKALKTKPIKVKPWDPMGTLA